MDEARDEREALVVALLLEAGRLMEDASPEFALALPDETAIAARVGLLEHVAGDLSAFATAARALLHLSDRT